MPTPRDFKLPIWALQLLVSQCQGIAMPDLVARDAVLEILTRLLEQADEVLATVGATPTADEALTAAIEKITELPRC